LTFCILIVESRGGTFSSKKNNPQFFSQRTPTRLGGEWVALDSLAFLPPQKMLFDNVPASEG